MAECYKQAGQRGARPKWWTAIKHVGFHYCTRSGMTIAINDIKVPEEKAALLEEADARIAEIEEQYQMGLITEEERYDQAVAVWTRDHGRGCRPPSRTAWTATAAST